MNYSKYQYPQNLNDVLNSCIRIESVRINRQLTIPDQVCFCLNAELVEQIAQVSANQTNERQFFLSANTLANLRYYALSNLPTVQQLVGSKSAFTFSTNYLFDGEQIPTTLFRSVIEPEGKISQQIKQELIENPSLLKQISSAHYWLITEIFAQLPLESQPWYAWLVVGFLAIAIVIVNGLILYLIPLNYVLKLLLCFSICWLLKLLSKILITKYLKSWIINHLVSGFLAKNTHKRKLGLKILSFLL